MNVNFQENVCQVSRYQDAKVLKEGYKRIGMEF